jgi:hypothetical protein
MVPSGTSVLWKAPRRRRRGDRHNQLRLRSATRQKGPSHSVSVSRSWGRGAAARAHGADSAPALPRRDLGADDGPVQEHCRGFLMSLAPLVAGVSLSLTTSAGIASSAKP